MDIYEITILSNSKDYRVFDYRGRILIEFNRILIEERKAFFESFSLFFYSFNKKISKDCCAPNITIIVTFRRNKIINSLWRLL